MNFYGDSSRFSNLTWPWAHHGGQWQNASLAGNFAFTSYIGIVSQNDGSRLVE